MTTGFARIVKEKYPDTQLVIGNKAKGMAFDSEIFNNNPHITKPSNIDANKSKMWLENYPGNRPYILSATKEKIIWNYDFKIVKGDLFFDNKEKAFAKKTLSELTEKWNLFNKTRFKKIVYIETSRLKKTKDNKWLGFQNRNWTIKNWEFFINKYKKEILFVQSIHDGSNSIDGIFSFQSNFREACAVMDLSDLYLGWEGGFAHAAAALDKKALVLFGGWIDPKVTGYNSHTNIYIDIDGSPCGMQDYCEHCQECIKLITPELVISKFEKLI